MRNSQSPQESRELLVGTWIGVALLGDLLVRARVLRRHDLDSVLFDAARTVGPCRRVPLSAMRKLLARLSGSPYAW